jgi:hypothetical protein
MSNAELNMAASSTSLFSWRLPSFTMLIQCCAFSQRAGWFHLPEQGDNADPFPRAGHAQNAQADQHSLRCAGDEQLQKW